jgi:hypothetical protein
MLDHLSAGLGVDVVAEEEARGSDGHEVAVAEAPLAHPVPVDQRPVGGVAVSEEILAPPELDDGVAAGHHGVGKDDVVPRVSADRQEGAGQSDLSP